MNKKHFIVFSLGIGSLLLAGCAEKKTRIWILPPYGSESAEKTQQKLFYQIEDIQTGKKENLIIPLNQVPENLVVSNATDNRNKDVALASATQADRLINEGKLPDPVQKNNPSVSYLRGMSEVEGLYQKAQFTEALVRLAPLIDQYPRQSRLYLMQGTLFKKIGEKKMALEAYKRAQQLEKNNPAIEEAVLKTQDELGGNI